MLALVIRKNIRLYILIVLHTYRVDADGEGLVAAKEDVLLCKMWSKVGMDLSIGTDQTKDTD
jgi:hypothetical protein